MSKEVLQFIANVIVIGVLVGLSLRIILEYFKIFLEKKEPSVLCKLRIICYVVWQVLLISGLVKLPMYVNLLISITLVIVLSFNYYSTITLKVILTIIYNSIEMLMEFFMGGIFISLGMDYLAETIRGALLSMGAMLLLVKSLQRFYHNEKIQSLPSNYNLALMLIPIGSMFVVYNTFELNTKVSNSNNQIALVSLLIMLAINITIFGIYFKLSEYLELREKNSIYEQEIDTYRRYINEKEKTMQAFRKAKHDLKNKVIYMQELLKSKKYIELTGFMKKLAGQEPYEMLTLADTDNPVIDAMVNHKYSLAKDYGIEFFLKLNVPTQLSIDDMDLCIILGNSLDNAIEGSLKTKEGKSYVRLMMRFDSGNLIVMIENSFDGYIKRETSGALMTRKDNVEMHGIGLSSIKKVVEKYHGYLKVDAIGKRFIVKIILYGMNTKGFNEEGLSGN